MRPLSRLLNADPVVHIKLSIAIGLSLLTVLVFVGIAQDEALRLGRNLTLLIEREHSLLLSLVFIASGIGICLKRRIPTAILAFWVLCYGIVLHAYALVGPFSAGALRIAVIVFLGHVFLSFLGRVFPHESPTRSSWQILALTSSAGLCINTIIYSLLSLFHMYTPGVLFWLDLGVGFLAVTYTLLTISTRPSYYRMVVVRNQTLLIAASVFVLVALLKSTAGLDHDSAWYALGWIDRISDGSFFEYTGYVNKVHYRPKGLEILSGWLSASPDYVYQVSLSAYIYAFLLLVLTHFLCKGRQVTSRSVLLAVVLLAAPAGLNLASTAKPDTLGLFAVSVCAMGLASFFRDRNKEAVSITVIAAAIAFVTKPHHIAYVSVLISLGVLTYLLGLTKLHLSKWIVSVICVGLLAAVFVNLRTYLLTGFVFTSPDSAVDIQRALGLTESNPFVHVVPKSSSPAAPAGIAGVFDVLFRPNLGSHIWYAWPGLGWLFLVSFGFVGLFRQRFSVSVWLCLATGIILFIETVILIGWRGYPKELGDGNYFIPGFTASAILIWAAHKPTLDNYWDRSLKGTLCVVIGISILLVFLSDWRWGAGTPDWLNLQDRTGRTTQMTEQLEASGLVEIRERFSMVKNCNALAVLNRRKGSPRRLIFLLPCRIEDNFNLSWNTDWRDRLGNKEGSFRDYVCWSGLDFILFDNVALQRNRATAAKQLLSNLSIDETIQSEQWTLYPLNSSSWCP